MFRRLLRRAGTGTSGIYITLISVCSVLAVVLLMIVVMPIWNTREVLLTAAQNGARVAAVTENEQQVLNAVQTTLTTAGLPTTYNGTQLFSISTTNVQQGPSAPVATVTVNYDVPIIFMNIFAGLGSPGPTWGTNAAPKGTMPMSVKESYINETYYGSE